jgi:nucleotide-binding universal stress UspA family protein
VKESTEEEKEMLHVLIATGGADHSSIAVQTGVYLDELLDVDTTILTIVADAKGAAGGRQVLDEARAYFDDGAEHVHLKLRTGNAAEEIIAEANSGSYDLIILGERQQRGLFARLLGPTALQVISGTTQPVLIAKRTTRPLRLRRILACDSGAVQPRLLQRLQGQLPQLLNRDIDMTVLHVMSQISAGPGVAGAQLRADAAQLIDAHSREGEVLAQDVALLAALGVKAQPKVRHGFVVDEILAEASSGDYDLIVIGAHRQEGWQRLFLEDLANRIIREADRPVLVVH